MDTGQGILSIERLPEDFIRMAKDLMGEETMAFLEALSTPSPVSVRLNSRKAATDFFPVSEEVPWCPQGRYLPQRPRFTLDPLLHAGAYYVQEASSMFLWQAATHALSLLHRPESGRPLRVLDLCAAPGGKSTLLRDLLADDDLLVANEIIHKRANVLSENLQKWGHPATLVCQCDPQALADRLPQGTFDLMLCDVPCSGEGMFRKEPDAIEGWSPAAVEACARRQREILSQAWPLLREGGYLIYSTCTYNTAENEDNVAWIASSLGADVLAVPSDSGIPPEQMGVHAALSGHLPVSRFLPHRVKGEGLFMCLLRKHGDTPNREPFPKGKSSRKEARKADPFDALRAVAKRWVNLPEAYEWRSAGSRVYAFPAAHAPLLDAFLQARLPILHAGIPVGEVKGRDLLPDAALALSIALNPDAFPACEVELSTALSFLRGESIVLPSSTPKGLVLIRYRGYGLGFVKNLGHRSNNLYPDAWRIRLQTSNIPEQNPIV